jgi:hypothetical protein
MQARQTAFTSAGAWRLAAMRIEAADELDRLDG